MTIDSSNATPTLASMWLAVSGRPLDGQFLDWPADMFAVTNTILERSEAYRFALSPNAGLTWPPRRFQDWPGAVAEAGRQWRGWLDDRQGHVPHLVAEEWSALRERAMTPLEHLADGLAPRVCEALLTLHAMA